MGIAFRLLSVFALRTSSVLLVVALWAANVVAAECGGGTVCQCGDLVVADAVLTGHLDSCTGHGLRIRSGNLDCAGHQISGTGEDQGFTGIRFDGGSGSAVQNCRVRNFRNGILVDGGSGHTVSANTVFNNRHGIWLGSGANDVSIDGNEVRDNFDEGIHLGSATGGNAVLNNTIHGNDGENLYLIRTSGNTISGNTVDQSKSAAILLKHSTDNAFTNNVILKRPIVIRGDSHGNTFTGTQLAAGGFLLRSLEEPEGVWSHPHDTTITGGQIDASTCFEFQGAYGNSVDGVTVDTCRHYTELEYGGLVPYGNSVSVIDSSPQGNGGSGGGGGTGGRGKLRFNRKTPGRDKLKVSYFYSSAGEVSPTSEDISVTLSDGDSVVFHAEIPAGRLVESSPGYFRYFDKDGTSIPGLREFRVRHYFGDLWRLHLKANANMSTADQPEMTLSWSIGDDDFATTDTWQQKRQGWKLRN